MAAATSRGRPGQQLRDRTGTKPSPTGCWSAAGDLVALLVRRSHMATPDDDEPGTDNPGLDAVVVVAVVDDFGQGYQGVLADAVGGEARDDGHPGLAADVDDPAEPPACMPGSTPALRQAAVCCGAALALDVGQALGELAISDPDNIHPAYVPVGP